MLRALILSSLQRPHASAASTSLAWCMREAVSGSSYAAGLSPRDVDRSCSNIRSSSSSSSMPGDDEAAMKRSGGASPSQGPGGSSSSSDGVVEDVTGPSTSGRLLDLFASPVPSSLSQAEDAPSSPAEPRRQRAPRVPNESDVIQIVLQAVENCKPLMKVQSIKTGTRMVHVPKVVMAEEQRSLAVRWIINAANKRKQSSKATSMAECLALELLLAYRKEGSARAKRDEMHKTALENKSNVSGYSLK